jgi:hypothetical protein
MQSIPTFILFCVRLERWIAEMESELREARAEGYAPVDEGANAHPVPDAQGFPSQGRPQAPKHSGSTWMTTPPRRSAPLNASPPVDGRHQRRSEHGEEERRPANSDNLSDGEPSPPPHNGARASVHSRVDLENGRLDEQALQVRQGSGDEAIFRDQFLRACTLILGACIPSLLSTIMSLIHPAFRSSGRLSERRWTSCETYVLCVNA